MSFRNNELHSVDFFLAGYCSVESFLLISSKELKGYAWVFRAMFYYKNHSFQLCISTYQWKEELAVLCVYLTECGRAY